MKTEKFNSPAPLSKCDWDFPCIRSLNWQVRFWMNYEYARESEEFKKGVEQIRAEPSNGDFTVHPRFWVLKRVLAREVPEFPRKAWLEIPEERRSQLLSQLGITKHTGGYAYGFIDRGHPETYFEKLLQGNTVGCIDERASFVLEFNFKEQDAFIVRGFTAWLKSTRAKLLADDNSTNSPYRATKVRKGKQLNLSRYWLALKDLSYFRRQRGGGVKLMESDTLDPKVAEAIIRRTKEVIALFSRYSHMAGFVEKWLEAPPRSKLK